MIPLHAKPLTELDEAWRASSAGERLEHVRRRAPALRDRILQSGRVLSVRTFDVSPLPYPTQFGFGGAATSPVPYLMMTNRATLVQFETEAGEVKTLLFNPTDAKRSAETPYFVELRRKLGDFVARRVEAAVTRPKPHEQLPSVGLTADDIDYVAFDHLHTQDLRGTLGTSGDSGTSPAYFPRAKLLVWRPELDIFRELHPLQRYWYLADGIRGVPEDRFHVCDGDVLLGKGVALVRTPGHTVGNWSLVIHTDRGLWAISENGIACDSYAPEASRIPGLRKWARRFGAEVVLNSNTLELRNEQYTSMVLEKGLVDRCPDAPEFHQHFSSSELTPSPLAPGLAPTYRHKAIVSGEVRRPRVARSEASAAARPSAH
jgi:hypothetical protein